MNTTNALPVTASAFFHVQRRHQSPLRLPRGPPGPPGATARDHPGRRAPGRGANRTTRADRTGTVDARRAAARAVVRRRVARVPLPGRPPSPGPNGDARRVKPRRVERGGAAGGRLPAPAPAPGEFSQPLPSDQ